MINSVVSLELTIGPRLRTWPKLGTLEFVPRTFYWGQRQSQVFFEGKAERCKTETCYSYLSCDDSATFDLPKTVKPLEKTHLTERNEHFKRTAPQPPSPPTTHTHTHTVTVTLCLCYISNKLIRGNF